jgi:hypothetical protein
MPRPIRSIDVYLPLDYNTGTPIEESKFVGLQRELHKRFGGVTSIERRFPLRGLWQTGGEVYQDRIIVFTSIDFKREAELQLLRYLQRLKARLKRTFQQLDVLITVQELLAV